jgi:hypothetical protein
MLALGSQLYQLTSKDLSSVGLEWWPRSATLSALAGASIVNTTVALPRDRFLVVNAMSFLVSDTAMTGASLFLAVAAPDFSMSVALVNNTPMVATGTAGAFTWDWSGELLLQSGWNLIATATRNNTLNAATGRFDLVGLSIPPGTFTRGG